MNGAEVGGNIIQVDFYDKKQTPVFTSVADVVGNENLRALFIKGLDKKVSNYFHH